MIEALKNFYHYWQTPKSQGVGSGNYAFEPQFTLPEFDELGISIPAGRMVNVFQPPQVYVNHQVPTSGLGGLVAGTVVNQPLIVPQNKQGSNAL